MAKKKVKRTRGAHVWKSVKDGLWYADIVSRNGNILCATEGYERKGKALRALAAIRREIIKSTLATVEGGPDKEAFFHL